MVAPEKFYIRSIAQPDLVLQDYKGAAVVGWIDPSFQDQTQQWFRMPFTKNSKLTNVGTGMSLTASPLDEGTLLTTVGSDAVMWNFNLSNESCVVAPEEVKDSLVMDLLRSNFNLGSPVGLWRWSGGAPNELWRFDSVGSIPRYATDDVYLMAGDPTVALKGAQDGRVFVGDFGPAPYDDAMLWTLTTWTSGISLKNKATGKWLAYGGEDEPLVQNIQVANQSVWTPSADYGVYYHLGYWTDPNWRMRVFSDARPKNGDTVGTKLAQDTIGEGWNIQARAADGRYHPWVYKPRDTKVVG